VKIKSRIDQRTVATALCFLLLVCSALGLSLLAVFSDVRPIVEYDLKWWCAYGIVIGAPVATYIYASLRDGVDLTIHFVDGTVKGIGRICGVLLALAILAWEAVFGGIPIVLHHLTSHAGEMSVTVVAKRDSYLKHRCRRRIVVKEFSFGPNDHLCPEDGLFFEVSAGSKLRVTGDISPYGIEPDRISWR
jgi:hypothetical protein